ncbi:UDP-2,4-diacetamido-2,4,6-trideoxy-beta-L-altropyranose hydrolase [Alteromonas sp. BL110]|uniref:UDP-2,4-diacetamido-2,4, 6-trideoxy-beta-L-altropyranose hydrolase n=1 Tax=Alteromonas sp. BL110 TaxID=1714845 RepID=UPI000E54513C|nr:UDP-2,4-diacetamido-2,4,6-trideoxy-beta-L-altropyranose hydrolase [Alteromonas sp. BL110]AXT37685.1 UDP-2,4-diacetamido-2,4,6-trideoxy-beta-L-altropyranose hydrolase [Alteromonas sp. BL110]RKM80424.1 UDP-2,4-diacetamido-2,4,6-trideoxy-beta-L-altropyranose hydrolase [Alteromonas sp. BL110]
MDNSVTVFIRADSAEHIGTGHVMRCLTLAKLLYDRGVSITFISKPHKGHCLDEVRGAGFKVIELPLADSAKYEGSWCPHANWLGSTELSDAEMSLTALQQVTLSERVIVIVDHFSLTSQWHNTVKEALSAKVVVIDGLADRALLCDVLIDPNLVLDAQTKWGGKIPRCTRLIIGPQYFPLREEFTQVSPILRKSVKRIFVCFGGMDKDNATLFVCELLAKWNEKLDDPVSVDVVIGKHHPHKQAIITFCGQQGIELHVQASNISSLMLRSDLAIGGGGTISWERCKMALPTVILTIAQNQVAQATSLEARGAVVYIGDFSSECENLNEVEQCVINVLDNLRCSSDKLNEMSAKALSVMDAYDHNQPWLDEIIS